jgi:hypothetical protein
MLYGFFSKNFILSVSSMGFGGNGVLPNQYFYGFIYWFSKENSPKP